MDVDFMRGIVRPVQQRDGEPLKSETRRSPLPIPSELALELSAEVAPWGGDHIVTDGAGRQSSTWATERAARPKVDGLPQPFRFHDLRHGSAKTTLDTYGHPWPNSDESARAAVGADWRLVRTACGLASSSYGKPQRRE